MTESKAVTTWDEELAKHAQEVASREKAAVSQIGLRAGVMMYQGQPIPGNKLECIILSSAVEHRYDTKPFDPNNIQPPDCFALSLTGEGMVPHPNAAEPQSVLCDTCAQHGWQPNPKRPGKNHKPCKERRRIALMPVDALKTGIKRAELAMMAIPVTSVKYWGNFAQICFMEFRRPPFGLISEIAVTPHPQNQFEVKFSVKGVIGDEFMSDIIAKKEMAEAALLTPYDASGMMVPGSDPQAAPEKARKF